MAGPDYSVPYLSATRQESGEKKFQPMENGRSKTAVCGHKERANKDAEAAKNKSLRSGFP